ncbi:unnamed protein product [Callosobruchus maculatus]|uniref:Bee-milk protein n=1 Tax=Callosobruchus maculatus TaxID=64391 RepID=A0A653CGQ5_CALMS|nr:unnamed protein product [Callosobruchus maculatus]
MHSPSLCALIVTSLSVQLTEIFAINNVSHYNVFETAWSWSYVNYTWPSTEAYLTALATLRYVPENVMLAGPRIHNGKVYVAMPKFRSGVPATLGYFNILSSEAVNTLITPFPSWEKNTPEDCGSLQSVIGMEIDRYGIMWVLDGHRASNALSGLQCPPKLVLLDLNAGGAVRHVFSFPNEICLTDGGFLNDIVIDDVVEIFAYITDNSPIDPGLIVYSLGKNKAWKFRDATMFPDLSAPNYLLDGSLVDVLAPIDGIALSPFTRKSPRTLYYTSLTGHGLFSISTAILKNENSLKDQKWRGLVKPVGQKLCSTDGMVMDSNGNLYYGLLCLSGVGKWNVFEPFEISEVIYSNPSTMVWPDGFTIDFDGNLYLLSNYAFRFAGNETLYFSPDVIKFRIHKLHDIGGVNYMYNTFERY